MIWKSEQIQNLEKRTKTYTTFWVDVPIFGIYLMEPEKVCNVKPATLYGVQEPVRVFL